MEILNWYEVVVVGYGKEWLRMVVGEAVAYRWIFFYYYYYCVEKPYKKN